MALKITDRMVDGVAVEALEGRIVLGEESNALREKVKSLLASGKKKIVLNMDNVTYIDSSGLGTLVASHTSARAQGASMKISNLGSIHFPRGASGCGQATPILALACQSASDGSLLQPVHGDSAHEFWEEVRGFLRKYFTGHRHSCYGFHAHGI